jgi:hypothetical protein
LFELSNFLGPYFKVVVKQPRKRAVAEHFDIGFGYLVREAAVGVWLHLPPHGTNERLASANFEPRLSLCEVVEQHLSMERLAEFVFCHKSLFLQQK